ncbi:zinc finger domain-containing protein [Streptomyces similanensis]|uniref:DNA-binding phage zinc finger domain-containing protein n=1 Tax=Streptomyces similanensis TaxID=1274988 RepID=A0ABP9L4A7_9ACTN
MKHRKAGGAKGQTFTATPRLASYTVPPASDVTITRPDGTTEIVPAKKPKKAAPARRRRRPTSSRSLPLVCAYCGYAIKGTAASSNEHKTRGKPIHPKGTCPKEEPPKRPTKLPPASTLPRGRGGSGNPYKNPNTRAVGPEMWSKVTCPQCRATPGKLCTARGVTTVVPHRERIQIVRRAIAAKQN